MHKTVFTIDGFNGAFIGYTDNSRWNGWATPYFEKAEALEVMKEYNECAESPIFYNEEYDTFYHFGTDSFSGEMWRGENYATDDGIRHLYSIGAYSWIWDDADKDFISIIAEKIEEIIFECDTYEYKDTLGTDRDAVINEIESQLKDFSTLKQALIILYNEDLTDEEMCDKLGYILKL